MTKLMVMVHIFIRMEQGMKDIGRMINSMVKELRSGEMVQNIGETITRGRSKVKGPLTGKMVANTQENS